MTKLSERQLRWLLGGLGIGCFAVFLALETATQDEAVTLLDFIGDAPLVAHNASFDLTFLKRGEAESGVSFDNPALCTLAAAAALEPALGDHSLDGLAERFGVPVAERHDALGDALATAALFLKLVDLMEARGIETLGQAMRETRMAMQLRAGLARW